MMNKRKAVFAILTLSIVLSLLVVAPHQIFAQTKKGIELCTSWNFQEAEKVLQESLKADPTDIQAAYYLGLSVLMQDKHSEALEIFKKLKSDQDKTAPQKRPSIPDEFQIQIALARTYLELKQPEEAWKILEAAKKEHANAPDLLVYRGAYYLQKEDAKKAIKELEKAMSLDGQNAYAHYYAGQAYIRLGIPDKAVEVFKEFLQLAPLAPEAVKAKALVDALC
jgi:tetratricopeptide (TPR) repeat protein